MAKIYNKKTNEIMWSDLDFCCQIEEAYWELLDFINCKKLDGHDMRDQWYMKMANKFKELLDVMDECPIDETDPDIKELF